MYQKLIFPPMLIISIVIIISEQLYAQEEGKIFIISERVDEVIDLEEGNTYKLFFWVKGLQSTVFFKLSDLQSSNQADLLRVIDFQSNKREGEKPPLRGGRIAGEFGAGLGGGILTGGIGYAIGCAVTSPGEGWFGGLRKFAGGVLGFTIGYPIGSSIGVYLVGNMGNETGSYWATLLGWIGGMATSIAIIAIEDCPNGIKSAAFFTLPVAGEVIGFNLTRRYKTSHNSNTALLNFRDGQIRLAVPTISFCPNPFDKGDLIQNIDLVKVRF